MFHKILDWFKSLWLLLASTFVFKKIQKNSPVKKSTKKSKQQIEQVPGQYATIRAMLEDMDSVFKTLKRMQPKNSSVQSKIRAYGPFIPDFRQLDPDARVLPSKILDGFAAYGLPSHMIMYWPIHQIKLINDNVEGFFEQYFCAVKAKSIDGLYVPRDCIMYAVHMVILMDDKPLELEYYIEINKKTGVFKAVRAPYMEKHSIPAKQRRKGAPSVTQFSTKIWKYPDFINSTEDNHKQAACKKDLESKFALAYNITMLREYGVNIIIKKGGRRVTITVPQNRWKYFFKDRIKVKTPQGNTKPIFHAVKAHKRELKHKTAYVKTHYKGVRHFFWEGYEILIVMQGKHGDSQASLDISSEVFTDDNLPKEGYVSMEDKKVVKLINDSFESI